MANSVIKREIPNNGYINIDLGYSTSTIEDFFRELVSIVLGYGIGGYTLGVARAGYYYCMVSAAVQSNNRCVIMVQPQVDNDTNLYIVSYNGGQYRYKKVALSNLT